jgi:N-acyl-D-aspartate/D-glutamate deacylase
MGQLAGPENIMVIGMKQPDNQQYAGKRLNEIAAMMHKDWRDAAMDLILTEHPRVGTIYFLMSEDNVQLQLRQPWIKFGIDGRGVDPDQTKGQLTHPRVYGTFPRVLGHYVRDLGTLKLEDAVRKMTSAGTRRWVFAIAASCRRGCLPTSRCSIPTQSRIMRRMRIPINCRRAWSMYS